MLKHFPRADKLGRAMIKCKILGCFVIELSPPTSVSLNEEWVSLEALILYFLDGILVQQ